LQEDFAMAPSLRRKARRGFTLVELLVVISIIAVLVGLAIPAIQMAQRYARQMECANNMRNIALAVHGYELTHRTYPGYSNVLMLNNGKTYSDPLTGQKQGVSWVIPLLANLDQPVLDLAWRTPVGGQGAGGQGSGGQNGGAQGSTGQGAQWLAANQRIELRVLICAADVPAISGGTPLSYVANCGMKDGPGTPATGGNSGMPRDWADNGVFFDLYTGNPRIVGAQGGQASSALPQPTMSQSYISRGHGVGFTLMLSENVDAGEYTDNTEAKVGMVWDGSGTVDTSQNPPTLKPPDDNMRINVGIGNSELQGGRVQSAGAQSSGASQSTVFARPSSFHNGGVNMAFCDGKVRFVSDSIDYYVYCLMMATGGSRVRLPGTNTVLPNFNRTINEAWLSP
jgi:prepilin-type N-terminal cleavage/methylation domain-containing protein/prepilin-type processing-associated H-X9-DG protein